MRIGVTLPLSEGDTPDGHAPTFAETAAFACHAEAAGIDSIWIFDHVLFRAAGEPDGAMREGWTTLAALAPWSRGWSSARSSCAHRSGTRPSWPRWRRPSMTSRTGE